MASFDPYRHVIKPMLAESRETPFDSPDHIFELKWDGTRAIAFVRGGRHRFQNRRLSLIEERYPDLKPRTRKDAILDGEIVVMDGALPSFDKLQEREKASGKIRIPYLARTLPATYIVFDILYVEDREVMSLSQMERKAVLREIVEEDERTVLSDYIEARGVDYYHAVVARGLEGIIAKHKDARYYVGKRSKDWTKIKKKAAQDCVIAGLTVGEGERRDTFGSIVLGAYFEGRLVHVGRVGTGFSEALRQSLTARLTALRQDACPFDEVPEIEVPVAFWTRPVIVAEVHFLEWSKDRHMRAPSFSRLREDKRPEDCTVVFPDRPRRE
jgi:bifunctional non-homologous end joining protein LigD